MVSLTGNYTRLQASCRMSQDIKYTSILVLGLGPTLFYNAQLVQRAFGIEADPVAYAIVKANKLLNSDTQ